MFLDVKHLMNLATHFNPSKPINEYIRLILSVFVSPKFLNEHYTIILLERNEAKYIFSYLHHLSLALSSLFLLSG